MALVPNKYLNLETYREAKFNIKTACSICTEPFDSKVRIPKVLPCGHSFCIQCIKQSMGSVQVSHCGSGEVFTSFTCFICRISTPIPSNKADGFATNFQLIEAIVPQDSRFMICTSCKIGGSETSFHICRECTMREHGYDVHSIINDEPPIDPDNYTICSTCVLKDHNSADHTIIEYIPIRLDYQFKINKRSVNVLTAQMAEKFCNVRSVLAILPMLVEKKEAEVNKMVEFMQRAKNRINQDFIFDRYKTEMNAIIQILDVLNTNGGKLNAMVSEKVEILEKSNDEINSIQCFPEVVDLKKVLKIVDPPVPTEVEPEPESEPEPEASESEVEDPVILLPENSPVEVIESAETWDNVISILKIIWDTVLFQSTRVYQIISIQATNALRRGNNENPELQMNANFLLYAIILMLALIFFKLIF